MTVQQLIDKQLFHVVNAGDDTDRAVTGVFCCDLLSIAMGKAPADSAWVTVMGNVNTIAVATLADVACVIIAEGAALDEVGRTRAKEHDPGQYCRHGHAEGTGCDCADGP